MSDDIDIRVEGRAGRITLNRPNALNALTWDMCLEIEKVFDDWRLREDVHVALIDGAPGRAFCAGGDIAAMHAAGIEGRFDYGRRFWGDEYRMNAKLSHFPKPIVSFLHGFTMGGGVGVGCHASHRIVDDTSRIAMPECGIGLVPDVGGTRLLARAPGRMGAYLGTTGARMGPGDALYAGFADHYIPQDWDALKAELVETGDVGAVDRAARPAPDSPLAALQTQIDRVFAGATLGDIVRDLPEDGDVAQTAREAFARNAPLSMACTVEILHRLGDDPTIEEALGQEACFTFRSLEQGDFVEGIRAQIIDKDRAPKWKHARPEDVTPDEVSAMLQPLGEYAPRLEDA
ncbi:putative enoyl-CoA hydratase echA8 [Jannaschia seosinensis]|uniref:3-hydroxyisobutyryl-CoA hydrolase n=1 Tax=Jannaschia seosinensis TaxID=313367 RepID=A0A0M7BHE7_9RHOB|nr:enoyl-CoA hydratase/isomerase family protein [Jannaschia seosinensis]CUH40815.1 putative enoyl-CoA hydratase echA8 [Jannaschia seosinensis]